MLWHSLNEAWTTLKTGNTDKTEHIFRVMKHNYLPISVPVELQSVVQPQEILSALIEKVAGVLLSRQAELLLCGHWCLIWEYPQQKHQNLQQICTTLKKNKHKSGRQVLQPTVQKNIQKLNQNYSTC